MNPWEDIWTQKVRIRWIPITGRIRNTGNFWRDWTSAWSITGWRSRRKTLRRSPKPIWRRSMRRYRQNAAGMWNGTRLTTTRQRKSTGISRTVSILWITNSLKIIPAVIWYCFLPCAIWRSSALWFWRWSAALTLSWCLCWQEIWQARWSSSPKPQTKWRKVTSTWRSKIRRAGTRSASYQGPFRRWLRASRSIFRRSKTAWSGRAAWRRRNCWWKAVCGRRSWWRCRRRSTLISCLIP